MFGTHALNCKNSFVFSIFVFLKIDILLVFQLVNPRGKAPTLWQSAVPYCRALADSIGANTEPDRKCEDATSSLSKDLHKIAGSLGRMAPAVTVPKRADNNVCTYKPGCVCAVCAVARARLPLVASFEEEVRQADIRYQ